MTGLTDDDVYSADTAENTPLLGCPKATIPPPTTATTIRKVVVLSCLFIFLLEFGAGLQIPSALALLGRRLCYEVQPGLPWPPLPDDPACKTVAVQGRLASFRGLQASLDVITWTSHDDSVWHAVSIWGRRPVLILATLGYTLSVAFQIFVCK